MCPVIACFSGHILGETIFDAIALTKSAIGNAHLGD